VATSGHIKDKNFAVEGGAIYLYDTSDWTVVSTLSYRDFVGSLSWAPDSSRLAFASTTGDLQETRLVVWDVVKNSADALGDPLSGSGTDVRWSPDGTLIAVDVAGGSVALIDPASGQIVRSLILGDKVVSVSWSPDSKRIAGAGQGGEIVAWEVGSGKELMTLGDGNLLTSMAWSPDGKYLASTGAGDILWIWDVR
jgi:WD40 repeat protein